MVRCYPRPAASLSRRSHEERLATILLTANGFIASRVLPGVASCAAVLRRPGEARPPDAALSLSIVIVFGLGIAGLVTAMAHRPGTDSRSELTWRADQAIAPALDTATAELDRIATDFEELGRHGRLAIAALTTGDAAQLQEAMAEGQLLVDRIAGAVAGVRSRLATLPGFGPVQARYFSPETIERWNDINAALDTTNGIGSTWLTLTTGGTDAIRLMAPPLEQHDEFVASAAKVGSEGDYAEAVRQLDLAAPVFGELRALQAELGNRVDVSLLTELLDRTARLDEALRELYTLLVLTEGEQTAEVDAALARVDEARAALPQDTRAISVILSEIGLAGPQQAVIAIEEARGRLLDAIGALGESEEPADGADPDADSDAEPDDFLAPS